MALSKLAVHYLEEFKDTIEADPPLAPSRLEQVMYNYDDSLANIPVKQVLLMYASMTKQGTIVCLLNDQDRLRVTIKDDFGWTILFDCQIRHYQKPYYPPETEIEKYISTFLSLERKHYNNLEIKVERV